MKTKKQNTNNQMVGDKLAQNINKADKYRINNTKETEQQKNINNISRKMIKRQEKQKRNNKKQEVENNNNLYSESESEGQIIKQQQDKYKREMNNNTEEEDLNDISCEEDSDNDTGQEEEESTYDSATESEESDDQQDSDSDAVANSLSEAFTGHQPNEEIAAAFGDIADKVNLSPRGESSFRGRRDTIKGKGDRAQRNTRQSKRKIGYLSAVDD
ncbi:hypothetical protein KY290_027289 [Solanum tuberosum]|uniref:Uncharacterized protein n=1 Tax=Solanum tuberosum TaxID=4113 RepID=A0ABQ7UGC3_SOLTU|nr:hypothetical protein KY290_027289 [Solanum tuberosum]